MAEIQLLPDILDLSIYAGDGVVFRMICAGAEGFPVDMSGEVKAQIRLERLSPDPPLASFAVDSADAEQGIIVLSLTGEETADLIEEPAEIFEGVWDAQWTPPDSEHPKTLCQGKVECVIDVSR
jgi:hypothetical protein